MAQKKFLRMPVVLLVSVTGLLIAVIAWLSTLGRKRNPVLTISQTLARSAIQMHPAQIDLWVAVARQESNDFTSTLYVNYHNLFAMAVPEKRESLRNGKVWSEGDQQYMSTFASDKLSVQDLIIWLVYTGFPMDISTLDAFLSALVSRAYFTGNADDYRDRLLTFLS